MADPVIFQIERIYYPVISAVAVPVNLVAIVILSRGKCGLSKCITRYLVGMAAADLLVVITDPILGWIGAVYLPNSFLQITPVCSLIIFLRFAATDVSVWLTVTFTFDRFVAICCQKMKTKYCTEKTAAVVIGTVSVLSCSRCVPWFFAFEHSYINHNIPWHCMTKPSFLTSPAWRVFESSQIILTPCVPFFLILLLNVLTVRRILVSSRVRRELRGNNNGENNKDQEMENRRKSIILLFSISGSFILLWMPGVLFYIYRQIAKSFIVTGATIVYVTVSATRMFQMLNCCTNTCIYVMTQAKFREQLANAVKYPFNLIVKLVKSYKVLNSLNHLK